MFKSLHKEPRNTAEAKHPPCPCTAILLLTRRQRIDHQRPIRAHHRVDTEINEVNRPYRQSDRQPSTLAKEGGNLSGPTEEHHGCNADCAAHKHEWSSTTETGAGAIGEDSNEGLYEQTREGPGHEDEGHPGLGKAKVEEIG